MTTISTSCTDAELSAAVAEHVAGWDHANISKTFDVPPFATDANAVLGLLEDYYWTATTGASNDKPCYRMVAVKVIGRHGWNEAGAGPFARAACFALLKANGVEVR